MGSPSTSAVDIERYDLTEVFSPVPTKEIIADLVLVHGLNGHPRDTWTSAKNHVFWPSELLGPALDDLKVRILVYGYDADVTSLAGPGVSKDMIHHHAENLVASLCSDRNNRIQNASERPIIFLAHSLGGLVVKRALIYSAEITGTKTEHLRSVFVSTYGILFLGTPHKGADLGKWGSYLETLCRAVVPKKIVETAPQLVEALKRNSETVQNIDRQFAQLMEKFHLFFFHEAKPTNFTGTLRFVVEEDSAAPTLPDVERASIQADHSNMCKFDNYRSSGFKIVLEGVGRYAEKAPSTIRTRWDSERAERKTQARRRANEIFPGTDASPSDSMILSPPSEKHERLSGNSMDTFRDLPLRSDPVKESLGSSLLPPKLPEHTTQKEAYFIVPPGFHYNQYSVGMEREFLLLDRELFNERRQRGTACVLLHGQAGIGKSHLARQYVYEKRDEFPGGVFWINARLFKEIENGFWQIAQKVVAKDSPQLRTSDRQLGISFVEVVKEWFERRRGWLIVLDGLLINTEEDIVEVQRFIPDSSDSSLIYVSRSMRLESFNRLLLPYALKVSPLSEENARKLLFQQLHILRPQSRQTKRATELVKEAGCLPLVINAISHRIAETHQPIEKFKIKSYSEDRRIRDTYAEIMEDLGNRGYAAAFNLINILCFYGPHIYVEMIHLGLHALRRANINVKSSESTENPDINITYGILMRYALLERNEPDDKDSTSSSRDSSLEPESIDVLKMHTVVQRFCCDSLNSAKMLPTWLDYAVKLFCHSFYQADIIIKSRSETGRISDYREYLVHGQRLQQHSVHYESKSRPLESIRAKLSSVLAKIVEQIRLREPGSSQESVNKGVFQISIFDRANSSSSSGQSGPTPPPLENETEFGLPLDKTTTNSPISIGPDDAIFEPKIMDPSPRTGFPLYYPGEGDESFSMDRGLSDTTMRPPPASPASQYSGWQEVPPRRRVRKPNYGSSFRPTGPVFKSTRTKRNAIPRPVAGFQRDFSRSSGAVTPVMGMHQASPPPPRDNGPTLQERTLGTSFTTTSTQPSYASVLAGLKVNSTIARSSAQDNSTGLGDSRSQSRQGIKRNRSLQGASRNGNAPYSPPRADFISPSLASDYPSPPPTQNKGPSGSADSSFHLGYFDSQRGLIPSPSPSHSQYASQHDGFHSGTIHPRGPNPAPLPLENITVTRAIGSAQATSGNGSVTARENSRPPTASDRSGYGTDAHTPYFRIFQPEAHIPTGYFSQPVSRDHSNRSLISATATEPTFARPPHASPRAQPDDAEISSPRNRLLDGFPIHKSPKLANSSLVRPRSPEENGQDIFQPYPYDSNDPTLLTGTGGWVPHHPQLPSFHFSPGRSQYSPVEPPSLSRNNSRPGTLLEGENDEGLGIIQFGEIPISIPEASARRLEYEKRLLELAFLAREQRLQRTSSRQSIRSSAQRSVGDYNSMNSPHFSLPFDEAMRPRYRGEMAESITWNSRAIDAPRDGSPPYPIVNLIPTESDPKIMEAMMQARNPRYNTVVDHPSSEGRASSRHGSR